MIDGRAQSVTAGGMRTAGHSTVEHQPGQMRAHCTIDDVGDRFVLARDGVQRSHVDTGRLSLSHIR